MQAVQILEQGDNHIAGPEIQVAGRLVGQQYRGFAGQGACEGDALLLTPR